MNTYNEDIFGDDVLKLVLRYGPYTRNSFNKVSKDKPFDKFVEAINHQERKCYFFKKDDEQHKIIIPMPETPFGGQLEIVAVWNKSNNTYEIKVNKNKKTRYNHQITTYEPQYCIEQICEIIFLDIDDAFTDFQALSDLFQLEQKVSRLEISPITQIENERDLWTKFVYAQSIRIGKLQEPFDCSGEPIIEEIKNDKGNISRYKIRIPIQRPPKQEIYEPIINEYKEVFGEDIQIDSKTGLSFLNRKQIEDLDVILERRFSDSFIRKSDIICMLKIDSLSLVDQIRSDLSKKCMQFYIENDMEKDAVRIFARTRSLPRIPSDVLLKYNLNTIGVVCKYIKRDEFDHNYYEYSYKEFGYSTPFYRIEQFANNLFIQAKKRAKEWIDNKDYVRVDYYIGCLCSSPYSHLGFNASFWDEIKRDLYGQDYTLSIQESRISFSFNSFENLENRINFLLGLEKFKLNHNPILEQSFRFKVRFITHENYHLSQSYVFRLEKLKNVSFVANHTIKDEPPMFIGSLSRESSENELVFILPYFFPEDKKDAEPILSLIKGGKNDIINVHANLRGDEVKLSWLTEAIDKLNDVNINSGQPNNSPINPKIRDFIFDSSKAEPTYKFDFNNIIDTEEYRKVVKRQLLTMNESQIQSVVKALYAKDLCLLQGPPGTGKTTVIAELIWQHIIESKGITRLLITSETNLAVDNALEKLMNGRNVSPNLSNFITIIKPLRFGQVSKFEEEGKRFSVERIEKWLDEDYTEDLQYENELSSLENAEQVEGESEIINNSANNAIQSWMNSIAKRSDSINPKYSSVLSVFIEDLCLPTGYTKRFFKDKYYKYANVIGSTCSSTGSPTFAMDYARIYSTNRFFEYIDTLNYEETISDIRRLIRTSSDESNDFAPIARSIIKRIRKENDIQSKDDLEELLTNPTENFKHFLFEYELKNLFRESLKPSSWKFENLLHRLAFNNVEEYNQFIKISFDTIIMDEASKATPPELLLPLCFGQKSIVIGDHRQLPPMLYEKDFKEVLLELNDKRATELAEEIDKEFIGTCQFARLILNPALSHTIKSNFNLQYRMHPQINDVIRQFYLNDEGGLLCGLNPERVNSSDLSDPESRYHGFSYPGFITPDVHTIWVDVDEPESRSESGALYNEGEVTAVKRVLTNLYRSEGFKKYMTFWDDYYSDDKEKRNFEKEIGIISFYSKQVSLLREAKVYARKELGMRIRLNTVDKFQGMERNIIIVSTVRSNKALRKEKIQSNTDPGFASSPERLNVALSRARRLLIIVGNSRFFNNVKDNEGNFIYRNVINEIQKHCEIIDYKKLSKHEER